jgi:predicted AlkP superfamily phosphohydrolase/phosphomutase
VTQNRNSQVLAIAIDAAEPELVRQMIEHDELPVLRSLLSQGNWIKVESPANLGSGAVWPTFITGSDPSVHGTYGEWCWQPGSMSLSRYHGRHLTPFWQAFVEAGMTIGILDLPFMPLLGLNDLEGGFEISEWAAHDVLEGHMQVKPERIKAIVSKSPRHGLSSDGLETGKPDDLENLQWLTSACLEGIKLRRKLIQELLHETHPRFALICFTEIHRAGHFLWHTVEPEHEVYAKDLFSTLLPVEPNLKDVYREVDRQIGALIQSVGPDTTVLVFSLHGMQPAHGVPVFLGPLLCEMGFARLANWSGQTWTERATTVMATVKRRTPRVLKRLYYQNLPATTTQRLARPTMLPAYDWKQTRAFSLPTDQHGWIRINLSGREAKGIVTVPEYEELCRELETQLRSLTTPEGKPLVRQIVRTSSCAEEALVSHLPDLVVHWANAIFESSLRIKGSVVDTTPVGTNTGQHALEGFCILKGQVDEEVGDVLAAKDMGSLISGILFGVR